MLIGPDSRMLQFSAHTFDASLVEILTTLICGGCVCIPSEEARLNGIAAAIKDMRVNHAVLTPSFVRFLAPSDVPGLKKLVLAGEALTQTDVETWCCIALCNGYGPTESSVAALVNTRISKHTDCHDIGFPVGVRCWVVHPEDHDILTPVGCCGELLLEGPALARGYINNPEKTKESFIFDPKWVASNNTGISNRRFYKTGDLVRYNSDSGSFDFVGRKDSQVKYHGQRIELGEIETHLVADFHTKHSLISLPKSGPLAGKLVAVVTLIDDLRDCSKKHGTPLKLLDQPNHITYITQMRERLNSIIPAYMVPSTWLCIEAFPVLASQKLDRKRVTEWLEAQQHDTILQCISNVDANSQNIENDLTETQRELRDIWSHVLNIPLHRISLKHSFLSLGGDSITAMTCMNLCKSKGLGLRVQEILRSKSIIDLAFYVKMISREADYNEDLEKPFDLSPIQDLHFRVRNDSQGHFNQSFFLRLKQQVNPSDIQRALETIISRHSMLRARYNYNLSKAKWEQRITRETTQSYRFKFHDKGPRDQAKTAISNSQASLNATTGPMVAVDLFHIGEDGQFLSLIGHHLVIDLVSWRVILEELEELLLKPQSPSLLEATLPFQNWCHLQANHAANIALETSYVAEDVPAGDMAYWGMLDRPNTYGDVVCVGFELDKSSTCSLLTKCNQALRTEPVDIMVAALLHSFHEIFPDHSLPVVHNEGHGREVWDQNIDVSRTIGWFTVIYPILVRKAAFGDFVETLVHVKDRRRRVSNNGRDYFARSILTNPNETSYRNMEICFNFLGRYQQLEKLGALFQPVEGLAGEATRGGGAADYGENTPRFGLFEISAVVAEDTLRFRFAFNGGMQKQDRIRMWISSCQGLLNRLSKDLLAIQVRTTIGDFPLMTLNYDDLSRLTTEILPEIGIRSLNDVEDIYPCSSMQEGLLISKTRDTSFYAVHSTYEITRTGGPVDAHRLADSWQQVVDRHAMLRTVIVENLSPNHLYSQVVLLRYDCKPLFVSCADESEVMSALDANTRKMNSRKPEHQFTICATRTGRVFCRLEMSHTTMDGTSTSLILRDLERAYGGSLNQSAKPLFSKFVSFLQSQPKQASINFWRSYLVNVEPCHIPILNDGLVAEKQYRTLRLKFNDFARLQSTCEQHGFTVPNALHGAWSLTLRCYTGSEEVCFGYLLSERDVPVDGVEDAIGPMINMLACRVNTPSEITVGHVLEQIQRDYMRSLPFKHTSLADVQHAIGLSGTALFNTCFSYRKLPPLDYSQERNIEFSECTELHDPTEYLVTINVEASDTNAVIDLDYWTDTLSDGQAANIAETFVKSLENVIDHLTKSLKDLEFLGDCHLEQIAKWNCVIPGSIDQCVHEVFEEQAKIRPDSPAVSSWDGNFTYSQISELSTRLCYYLLKNGLSSEIAVALCFDKSAYTIIAMLAILKAGGTCVPLDAGHPKAALDLRVLEANAQFVLSSPSRVYLLEDIVPCGITVDEALFDQIPAFEEMAIEKACPENAAFIMFTSGSTGKPKGVVLEHRNLVTSAAAHGEALGVGPASRFLQFASYSFDNSLEEIFTTLMRGGCVCIPSEDDRMNNLAKAMEELSVNIADLTPTVVAFLQPSDVPCLKTLAIGGEAPTKDIRDSWGKALDLQNIYGPTECSINCCHNPNIGRTGDITNIGRSIGSLSWVANPNDHNHLLPIGCTGELLIEGPILARGYLNNPDKAQQNFIENPKFISQFRNHDMDSEAIGSTTRRIYKTGDLVRYNSDGSLVYIGRKDTQVKLNGQRIELGEIEHRVHESLPSDGQCAVDLIGSKKGKSAKFLVVFVCLKESDKAAPSVESELIKPMSKSFEKMAKSVKSSLVSCIQMYMVPNVYIPISSMPITSSGKLDRRLLRTSCERLSTQEISTYRLGGRSGRPASTEPEKLLHRLWASILDIDGSTIGADDTFFRHGGDSISAIRLVTSVRLEGYSLGVADIFQRPKLSDMAQSISGQSSTVIPQPTAVVEPFTLLGPSVSFPELRNEIVSICQIPTEAIEDVYPCSALQEGLVAISSKQPGSYVTQNVYSLAHRIDIRKFKAAWEMVAVSETILRTRIIHSRTHGFFQVVVREPLAWTSVENIGQLPETHNHLPKSHGGILSCYTIIGEDSETPGFIWTAHHAVYDGWSLPLLLAKVKSQYYGFAKIDRNPRCSYPQFIKYMRAVDRDQCSVFWKDKLDGSTTTRFPVSPVMLYKTSPRSQISDTVTLPDTSEIEATVPSIIRAAWALTISVYTFSDDVIFGEILTGRDAPLSGISDMIGPTLATVPMRLRLNRDLPIVEYLHDVQTQAASVIPYQFFGLQNIKRLTDDARSACDFQNIFTVAYYDSDDAEGLFNLASANSGNLGFFTYPLNVSCIISGNQIRLQVDYDQRVLPTAQLKRLLTQFETILANLCFSSNAEMRLGDLDLMGHADLALIRQWNMSPLSTVNQCVHEVIDENARLRPETMAICSWDGTVTYRELSEYSTSLAHQLRKLVNIETGSFVPICFEKSLFTPITMLAIMKAGCAFVPLDSQHPTARLRQITGNLGTNFILCSPCHVMFCEQLAQKAVAVDWDLVRNCHKTQSSLEKVPSHLPAYAIFTSGSTGQPKGCISK
jgi:amino acid adenylation domain-containing protein